MKKGNKIVIVLYIGLLGLLILEVRHFIKLREQVSTTEFKQQLKMMESEFETIKTLSNNIKKTDEVYPEIEFCLNRNNTEEFLIFFKEFKTINYQNIDSLLKLNSGCFFSRESDYYKQYNLKQIYDNNFVEGIALFKEELLYNQNIKTLVNSKINEIRIQLTNFKNSLELMVGDQIE